MVRPVSVAALACAAVVGCSLLVDTSGLAGAPDQPEKDAAPAPPADATIETAPPDASTCPPNTDLTNDPKNCGRCAHDCLGGACSSARCRPAPFVEGQDQPAGVAADAKELFWSTLSGDVRAKRLDGTGAIRQIAKLSGAGHIEVDDTFVYVPTFDDRHVFRVPKAGGPAEELATCAGPCLATGLGKDGTLYFTERQTDVVRRLTADGGTVRVSDVPNPEDVIATATDLFVASEAANEIIRIPRGGGASSVFLSVSDPVSVAIDGNDLWVVSQSPGIVYWRPFSGGTLDPVATQQETPTGICVTPSAIYWACLNDGRIMRLAR